MVKKMVIKGKEQREKEGWKRQFVSCDPRLTEFVTLYKELGYEVLLEPVEEDDEMECRTCFEAEQDKDKYKVIYTRTLSS